MKTTLLLSYPPADWQIRGGKNFRSEARRQANPRHAMTEWLRFADTIVRCGGQVVVMPPPKNQSLTGLMYTANAGAPFWEGASPIFVISKMAADHRKAEFSHIREFITSVGLPTVRSQSVWEGQADILILPGSRVLLSWGVRSEESSVVEVRARLPDGMNVMDVKIQNPYFHGDTCLNLLTNRAGDSFLLVYAGALVNRTVGDLQKFVHGHAEVIAVDEADALAYVCNALVVEGTVLMPEGVSTALRGQLIRRGFQIEELAFTELFGKGGGGPRCLVNEWRNLPAVPYAFTYSAVRDQLHDLLATYPDSADATDAPVG